MKVPRHISDLVAYKPGKPIEETQREFGLTEIHKLASNECPLGPSSKVLAAMKEAVETVNIYPDPTGYKLAGTLADMWGVPRESIAFGNGSNECLDVLIRTFCDRDEHIMTSQAAFIAYKICAQAAGVETREIALNANLGFDLASFNPDEKTRIVFLANPNNPTGTYVSESELVAALDRFAQFENLIVVLDEAYNEFVRCKDFPDGFSLMKKYKNVMVMKTLSKVYGLAGLRIGVLVGDPELISYYHRVRNPFNVNSIAQAAALSVLADKDFLQQSQKICWDGLDYFYAELTRLGLPFVESQTNFVLFDCQMDSGEVNQKLLREGVILRPVKEYGLPTHMRMSVGLEESNRAAIRALEKVLK